MFIAPITSVHSRLGTSRRVTGHAGPTAPQGGNAHTVHHPQLNTRPETQKPRQRRGSRENRVHGSEFNSVPHH